MTDIKVTKTGNKMTVNSGAYEYFFSYSTLVCVFDLKNGWKFQTKEKYSKTTTKHINKYWEDNNRSMVSMVSQNNIEVMLKNDPRYNELISSFTDTLINVF